MTLTARLAPHLAIAVSASMLVAFLAGTVPAPPALAGAPPALMPVPIKRTVVQKRSHKARKRRAAEPGLAQMIDELQLRLPNRMAREEESLMEILSSADDLRAELTDQMLRIRMLEAQAEQAEDSMLLACLLDREKRAKQLVDGADNAYKTLLTGITEEDVGLVMHSLDVLAILPQLKSQLIARKDACVGTVTGVYVEYTPRRTSRRR